MKKNIVFRNKFFIENEKIGNFREKRVKEFILKKWKWNCYKSTEEIDKFNDIDLIAYDKNNNIIFIQVKSLKMINKILPSDKSIRFANLNNAKLYYFYVGKENEKIYVKRIK